MIRYQLHLNNDFDYSNTTVNTYTVPITSEYDFLSRNRNYDIRIDDAKLEMLPDEGENTGC